MFRKHLIQIGLYHWGPIANAFEEELAKFFKSKPNNTDFSAETYPKNIQAHHNNPDELWSDEYEDLREKQVVALCSGTAAVHLALINLGVKTGDEVICQSFTFVLVLTLLLI